MNQENAKRFSYYPPTPPAYSQRLRTTLAALPEQREPETITRRPWRTVLVVAALVCLLTVAAMAAERLGVAFFYTQRTSAPVDLAALAPNVQVPLGRQSQPSRLAVQAQDAVWTQQKLGFTVHVAATDAQANALLCAGDFGVDGVHSDWVWVDGQPQPVEAWIAKDKQALLFDAAEVTIAGSKRHFDMAIDWVREGGEVTMLCILDLLTVTPEEYTAMLAPDGTLTMTLRLQDWLWNDDDRQETTLSLTMTAPTTEEWKVMYDA